MYKNNTNDTRFPLGDFVEVHSTLPAIFPIENLTSDSKYDWVYLPSFTFFTGKWIKNFEGFTEETLINEYNKGRFSLNPNIRMLRSGEVYYFNKNAEN
ncbi:hypothetical protein [Photobacterium marinum]|uniref:hypothetical protein n=1 Tax=Photobacterium marinum TaxID=1056511 RepID=UPI000564EC23|nr:hypothetical protein [Photobacterium marinum]